MTFKERVRRGDLLIGTFQKTPSAMVSEVLARAGLDMVCLDAEHAPFDRSAIDACLLALSAGGVASLVRVPAARPEHILNALDCGADGVLAPHVITGADAAALAAHAQFGRGRGYAGSTRAAGYGGRSMAEHLRFSAEATVAIAQIEDREALDHLDDVFATEGVDAFFVGRADLAVSLGADSPSDPRVIEAVEHVCRRGRDAGVVVGMFTGDLDEIPHWRALGASFFLLGSDHAFMTAGAAAMLVRARG